jgi:tRNA modification GTPase
LAVLEGVPIHLTDTAGLWEQAHGVDAEAVRRSRARARQADLVVLLSAGPSQPPAWLAGRNVLCVWSKADLAPAPPGALAVSAVAGTGMKDLSAAILAALGLDRVDPQAPAAFTQRQVDLLSLAVASLHCADVVAAQPPHPHHDLPTARAALVELLEGSRRDWPAH